MTLPETRAGHAAGLLDMLWQHGEDDTVIVHQDDTLTRRELRSMVHQWTRGFSSLGVQPGDRVLLVMPNSVELLVAYYACLAAGLVSVPVNERQAKAEIQRIVDHARPRMVISTEKLQHHFELGSLASRSRLELVIDPPRLGAREPQFDDAWRPQRWPDEQDAMIFYTSGSTGQPKGAVYTHGTLRNNSRIYRAQFDLGPADRSVLVHCMAHNFLFSQLAVPFLDAGGSVQVVDFGSCEQTAEAMQSGATFLAMIPWFAIALFEYCERHKLGRGSLRVCMLGGDRPPDIAFELCRRVFGVPALQNIGMTETNTYAVNMALPELVAEGAAGRPLPEVQIEIRDSDGNRCLSGVSGEIWVRTPARMDRYWNDPIETEKVVREGWLATGDSGHIDGDGLLWFDARIRNIIVCDGDNVYPGEVEKEIARHPHVRQAVVLGLPQERHGEIVAAAVVLHDGCDLAPAEMQKFLETRLSIGKIPSHWSVFEALPASSNGKLDLEAIRQHMQHRKT